MNEFSGRFLIRAKSYGRVFSECLARSPSVRAAFTHIAQHNTRLQNVLKVKDKELEDARKEITALKTNLSTKDR